MTTATNTAMGWSRQDIARKIAADIPDGAFVNLGIGMPESVVNHIPDGREVIFHTENGLLGMGPAPPAGEEDPELINAGKRHVTAITGASFFHHADSFAMIRGGHIDICVLGAMQVSQAGDLANWSIGEADAAPAVGGAMDLVAGAKQIFVATQHCTKSGKPKLVESITLPATGLAVVSRVYTDMAIFDVRNGAFELVELAPDIDLQTLQDNTGAAIIIPGHAEAGKAASL
ncbi:MAG TPA: 3-oxoacid CoA-transferase subunit B [Woeseiaceae bacterium]|nr:3-oxoacid CoA-transferase subunit B [Woeseiaceae bacterium]